MPDNEQANEQALEIMKNGELRAYAVQSVFIIFCCLIVLVVSLCIKEASKHGRYF